MDQRRPLAQVCAQDVVYEDFSKGACGQRGISLERKGSQSC